MNKDSLVEAIAAKLGNTKSETERMVDAFTEIVSATLSRGEDVSLTGFGVFTISRRAPRMGVNPRTGEKIQIPAMALPKFRAGKGLKDAVK